MRGRNIVVLFGLFALGILIFYFWIESKTFVRYRPSLVIFPAGAEAVIAQGPVPVRGLPGYYKVIVFPGRDILVPVHLHIDKQVVAVTSDPDMNEFDLLEFGLPIHAPLGVNGADVEVSTVVVKEKNFMNK